MNFLFVSANVSRYRSYKNYKCFNVQGDRIRIERLRHALQESDVSIHISSLSAVKRHLRGSDPTLGVTGLNHAALRIYFTLNLLIS